MQLGKINRIPPITIDPAFADQRWSDHLAVVPCSPQTESASLAATQKSLAFGMLA